MRLMLWAQWPRKPRGEERTQKFWFSNGVTGQQGAEAEWDAEQAYHARRGVCGPRGEQGQGAGGGTWADSSGSITSADRIAGEILY